MAISHPSRNRIYLSSSLTIPFLLLVLLCSIVASIQEVGAASTPGTRSRKFGKSPVFSLFNLKAKSKFWSESVIRTDFDDLEGSVSKESGRAAVRNYTTSANLANYMKLSEIDSIYLPVPVNFIFIGFEGKGNYEFKLGPEELERWFTKIDHIFEHTRIPPVGEIMTPFYKTNIIQKNQRHHLPLVSHVNYNFSVHAVLLGEKVTSVFEYAIKTLSRKDAIHNSSENVEGEVTWQVDMDRMEYLFETLVNYLLIQDSYNIFILNPKFYDNARYGYRSGLSEPEINLLKENITLQGQILQSESNKKSFLEIDRMASKPLYYNHRTHSNFAWTTTEDLDMIEWSKKSMEALETVSKFNEGKDEIHILLDKASQIVHHGRKDGTNSILENELKSRGDLGGLHSDCLTDSWISQKRWAFIDLSAGPFTWGPAVGGEGVRTELSLPSVKSFKEMSEEEAEEQLQGTIRERFSSFDEPHHAVDILLAEMDVYELFAFKHCKNRRTKLALCDELDARMRELKGELEEFRTGEAQDEAHKASEALKKMESWNLFTEAPEENTKYKVARDLFLAHLGSTLWGAMRHVIAPSISDEPYHYYEKISFQLYFITQERVRSVKQLPVNINAFKEGLNSLILPSQKSMFTQHLVSLVDDPALTMAFAVSRHAAAVPLLLVNGSYRSTVRISLDSSILQYQLQRLNDHSSLKGEHANKRGTLEVPVFWFIHNEPVLKLDKHYQAKSLSNMVLVVQSENPSWDTHLQCNGQGLLSDLRNPIKAAVAATAEHLAGLLPLHLVYSHAHDIAIEDWTWSIGSNPLSMTSQGFLISGFQSDTIARSYIITSLDESIQVLNKAILLLVAERTNENGFKLFKSRERMMIDKYNSVISLWRRISSQCGKLRYGEAVKLLSLLEDASHGFAESVNTTISMLHPVHCTRERKLGVEFDATTIPAFIFVFGILWFLLRPKRAKPKIN